MSTKKSGSALCSSAAATTSRPITHSPDPGLRPYVLPDPQRGVEEPVEDRAGATLLGGRAVRLPNLPEYLCLPDDHRVQGRGHAVEMAHRLVVREPVGVPVERGAVDAAVLGQKVENPVPRASVPRYDVDLGPVARREQHRLRGDALVEQPAQERSPGARRERHPLAHLDGGRAGAHPRKRDQHRTTPSSVPRSTATPSPLAVRNLSTMPAHSTANDGSIASRILRASVGEAPPVETATCSPPRRKTEGRAKSPSAGLSATFTGMPPSFASRATAAFTSRESVAAKASDEPARSPGL